MLLTLFLMEHQHQVSKRRAEDGAAPFSVYFATAYPRKTTNGTYLGSKFVRSVPLAAMTRGQVLVEDVKPDLPRESDAVISEVRDTQNAVLQPPVFLDPGLLEVKPIPRSAPDFSDISAEVGNRPVLPITLRIFVLDSGRVYRVQILKVQDEDRWVADKLVAALLKTGFVAGQQNGIEVSVWQDLQFSFVPPNTHGFESEAPFHAEASVPATRNKKGEE